MQTENRRAAGLRLSATALKFIAIITMTVDHIAFAFVPPSATGTLMHFIGYATAPVMFYFAVEGYHHTRSVKKYIARLAVFAAVSWLPFVFFVNGGLPPLDSPGSYLFLNVIYTIMLGVTAVHVRRNVKNIFVKTLLVLLLIIASAPANWGYYGVIIILIFDFFYGSVKKQALWYCAFVAVYVLLNAGFDITLGVQLCGMFLPAVLFCFYGGQRGGGGAFSKWFFYVYYPLHLAVLGALH